MELNSNDPISIIFLKGFFDVINKLRRFKMPEDFLRCVREGGKVITKVNYPGLKARACKGAA